MPIDPNRPDIQRSRFDTLCNHFLRMRRSKTLFLTSQYPFIFIGTIETLDEDYLKVLVETSIIEQLEGRTWHINVKTIQAFYSERQGGPAIPQLIKPEGD